MKPEQRFVQASKARLRVERRGDKPVRLVGYGAVFYDPDDPGTQYRLWSDTYERIAPGAFDRAIAEDDTRSLFNHDANIVLGRKPATLSLSVDSVGLRYEVTPPDTQLVRDQVVTPIERGDVSGSSFMFFPRKVAWIEEEIDGRSIEIREIQEVELVEVGPNVFPAYEATTTGVRAASCLGDVRVEYDEWRLHRRRQADQAEADSVSVALRLRGCGVASR